MVANGDAFLTLHLWDLRAQVEAQLRRLTKVHTKLEKLGDRTAESFPGDKALIIEDLSDIVRMSANVSEVSQLALEQAHALGGGDLSCSSRDAALARHPSPIAGPKSPFLVVTDPQCDTYTI